MKICTFVLIALVAISAAQQYNSTNYKKDECDECIHNIEETCESGTWQENEDCYENLDLLSQCLQQCKTENKGNINNIIRCAKQNCKSENKNAQTYFDQEIVCLEIQVENPSNNNEEEIDLDQENINNTETPCQSGSKEEIKACQEELKKIENCLTQCTEQNQENTNETIRCYKSNCKSENKDVQDYFEKKIASMNTGINILAFTVIASVLSLLL